MIARRTLIEKKIADNEIYANYFEKDLQQRHHYFLEKELVRIHPFAQRIDGLTNAGLRTDYKHSRRLGLKDEIVALKKMLKSKSSTSTLRRILRCTSENYPNISPEKSEMVCLLISSGDLNPQRTFFPHLSTSLLSNYRLANYHSNKFFYS